MPVPASLADLSQTTGSNFPSGGESPTTADDYLRTHASFMALMRDGKGHTTEADVASAATCDVGALNSLFVRVTGAVSITSLGTNYNGPRFIRFAGALTLVHSATLVLPGAVNLSTTAGDSCIAVPIGTPATGWQIMAYQLSANSPSAVATGSIHHFPSVNAPSGYLKANGQLVSRTTYASLWTFAQASGNIAASDGVWTVGQFSPGDGSTTFRVPKLNGYTIRSFDDGAGVDAGRAIGSVQSDQAPAHNHTFSGATDSQGNHSHEESVGSVGTFGTGGSGATIGAYNGTNNGPRDVVSAAGTHAHNYSGTTSTAGSGTEVRVKSIALLACIKY